jgi:hypothetical protein
MKRTSTRGIWRRPFLAVVLAVCGVCVLEGCSAAVSAPAPDAQLRVNLVGYGTGSQKIAVLMATHALKDRAFSVADASSGTVVLRGTAGADLGAWNARYAHTYRLEFTKLTQPGRYTLRVGATRSDAFAVDAPARLYTPLLANAWRFFEAQKDGAPVNAAVMNRKPAHLEDKTAGVYEDVEYDESGVLVTPPPFEATGERVDVSGGWVDAGDYLKFTQTTSYTTAMLEFAVRQYGAAMGTQRQNFADEARWGVQWLQKMWDDKTGVLYMQVGIGDGNGTGVLGDHDRWRLPEADDALNTKPGDPAYFLEHRPVFRANAPDEAISPNLAGRVAASFALCYQLWRDNSCLRDAVDVYRRADTDPSELRTVLPSSYYPESEWRDDMELAAIELERAQTLAGRDGSAYLKDAARWARAYIASSDRDELGVYDVAPLAHFELLERLKTRGVKASDPLVQAVLEGWRAELRKAESRAKSDPFNNGVKSGEFDAASDAIGTGVGANLERTVARDFGIQSGSSLDLGALERDWVLGRNAWGLSFVIGAGARSPRCPQHQIANITGLPLLGGVVGGPNGASAFKDLDLSPSSFTKPCALTPDPYAAFNGRGATFVDNVASWPTGEAAIDYSAASVVLFAQQLEVTN